MTPATMIANVKMEASLTALPLNVVVWNIHVMKNINMNMKNMKTAWMTKEMW